MCSNVMARVYQRVWRNYSNIWNDSNYFDDYVCRAANLYFLREHCVSFNGHAYLVFGIIGLVSAVASLIIFHRDEFSNRLVFLMYKTVAGLELVQMTVMILLGLRHFFECSFHYWCQFISAHFSNFLLNTSAEAVDFIVLFLCIERSVACLLPNQFRKIHNKRIFVAVIAVALTIPAIMNFPTIFQLKIEYNVKFGKYTKPLSMFGNSSTFRLFSEANAIRLYVVGALIIAATCCSILGLLRARGRKLSTRNRNRFENDQRQDSVVHEHFVEMCILQLCLAVPAVLNYILFATMRITSLEREYSIGEEAFARKLQYDDAANEIVLFSRYFVVASAVLMTNFLAHAFHFYLYLIFCSNIRRSFVTCCSDVRRYF